MKFLPGIRFFKTNNMKNYTTIPMTLLDMGEGGNHLIIKVKINGKTGNLVLDTGASKSVFDKTRFERFRKDAELTKNAQLSAGVGNNDLISHAVLIKKIQFGKLVIKEYDAVLMDLAHVNESYVGMGFKPMDGVLGSDILYVFKAIIDYSKMTLTFNF
jgi:predicted aspartyl protease